MPIDYSHQHVSTSIVRVDSPHESINPSGGGSVSVTDGTTTVDPASGLSLPVGTLTDLGSGLAGIGLVFSRLTFDVTVATPGFLDAQDDGPVAFSLPGGSAFLVYGLCTTSFGDASPNNAVTVYIVAGDVSGGQTKQLTKYHVQDAIANAYVITEADFTIANSYPPHWALAKQDIVVCVAAYSDIDPPPTGAMTFIALVATPAS